MSISAIILAGGNATRMGGANKGLVKLANTPLISFVIYKVSSMVDEVLISANRDIAEYEAFGYPVLTDQIKDTQPNEKGSELIGPLAGLHAGLSAAAHEYILCVPCDMPNLPPNLALRLLAHLQHTKAEIAVVKAGGDTIPVVCLCKKSVLPSLTTYIQQGGRKVSTWQKSLVYTELDLTDTFSYNKKGEITDQGGDFANLNSLQDIADYE
jgi:molybdenum cofactor guanylyltransferase